MIEFIAINVAYAIYVAASLLKSMIRLRIGFVVVSLAFIFWGVVASNYSTVLWNAAFGLVNLYQLLSLWNQRRRIALTEQETELHQRLFGDLDLIDFFTLWSIGDPRIITDDEVLIAEGASQDTVMLIVSGSVVVERNGSDLANLGPDSLLGERSYMTGEPASATVRATSEVHIHEWDQRRMKTLGDLCPAAHESMVRYISADLAKKL